MSEARSRTSAYLADYNHVPLGLLERLLDGCSVVGVRTGAPFIHVGVTGVFVDRLPLGAKWVKNDGAEAALAAFVDGVQRIQQTDRHSVRAGAGEVFGTEAVAERVLQHLFAVRMVAT